jgi:uncharacterized protein (DUF2062 family)
MMDDILEHFLNSFLPMLIGGCIAVWLVVLVYDRLTRELYDKYPSKRMRKLREALREERNDD